jgi:acyl-[acyl-carrier-protein]-phospholipid O-acyltransferase/long-chain-fatty-acid--[acyl-carrier-protein] ligase
VIHKALGSSVDTIVERLSAMKIPNLWIPSRDSFLQVAEIPLLAAGKMDLKSIKKLAMAKFSPAGDAQ